MLWLKATAVRRRICRPHSMPVDMHKCYVLSHVRTNCSDTVHAVTATTVPVLRWTTYSFQI